jgi:chemotaxis protein CheX
MKDEFINPFVTSVIHVLSVMATLEAKAGSPATKSDEVARGNVTGIIGMTGEKARGTVAINFTGPVVSEIAQRMLGEEVTEIDEMVTDMVGELTNMVSGGAKKLLSEAGYRFDSAIPTMISGTDHIIQHKSKAPVIIVPFSTEVGDIFIELCFEEKF